MNEKRWQMSDELRLMCIFAHPDDESLGTGGTLARYGVEGVKTGLVTATRGEQGWNGPSGEYPGPEALGKIREGELRAAAAVLGLNDLAFLDYQDGQLAQVDPLEAVEKLVGHLRRFRPQVVITFDPFGGYGHPDHIAVCQWSTAAIVAAADPGFSAGYASSPLPGSPHRVSKLYYMVATQAGMESYQDAFGQLVLEVDGQERTARGWEQWAITTRIDTGSYWQQVWRAISCHQSQLPGYEVLIAMPEERRKKLMSEESFYRVFSLVDGGQSLEEDLFAGLR